MVLIEPAANPEQAIGSGHAQALQAAKLRHLLESLSQSDYRFVTPTPLTHQRVLVRCQGKPGQTLRDIFGWNLPFLPGAVTPRLLVMMEDAGVLHQSGGLLRSAVRIASLGDDLFLHSAYPTSQDNAVFFGPDTYRFARFIRQSLRSSANWQAPARQTHGNQVLRVVDVGCGSGAGGIAAARALAESSLYADATLELSMNDINPLALQYTSVNADRAGIPVAIAHGNSLSAVSGNFDLIISNPPYLDDALHRSYRDGGERLGRALSVQIAAESLKRLAPGGQLLLYTGVAIIDGIDPFHAELLPLLGTSDCDWSYTEIDPDIFGEELDRPVYAHADRIAAVGLIARRKAGAR